MGWIDLRSDTVTMPSESMKKAMVKAQVGDDVLGDDYTTQELENRSSEILGKEAALFVPSGTFANQLALLTLTSRGDEVIIPQSNHINLYEVGAASVISNVQLRIIESINGKVSREILEKAYREEDIHYPRTGLICLENAHSSGRIIPIDNISIACGFAKEKNIPTYLDGARIFNAAISMGIDVKDIAAKFDALMFCFSKGLSAPIGSVLIGKKDFIQKAKKNRKMMGGGMRQVGYMAAPCLVALEQMVDRLKEDHENARYLAEKIADIKEVELFSDRLDINMVFFRIKRDIDENILIDTLYKDNVKILGSHMGEFRLVTHFGITKRDIDKFSSLFKKALKEAIYE